MQPRDRVTLEDIAAQARTIQRYLLEYTHDSFIGDTVRQDAVIRRLEIIGEAANRLSVEFCQTHYQVEWRVISDMRNFLIHAYDAVDIEIVWKTAQLDIAPLLMAVEQILAADTESAENG